MTPRTGRRPGGGDTRKAILEAARRRFARDGYAGATMRRIARDAGVDAALVHHYFGTKDRLFAAALEVPVRPQELLPPVLAAGPDGLGERLLRLFLSVWDAEGDGGSFAALIRSAVTNERAAALLREFVTTQILGTVTARLDVDRPRLRASLVGTQLVGLGMARYVLRLEPVASAPPDALVALVAPTLQRYLTGDLPGRTARPGAAEPGPG
ncbi:MAG: TetR family transcriptional regulator [Actinomycetota bacterium]|nr:TetR family transcriptional regulator [Actinomycetota bacterium]